MRALSIFALLLLATVAGAQQIEPWRTPVDNDPLPWRHCGYGGAITNLPPTFPVVVNATNSSFNWVADGSTDNSTAWTNSRAAALASLSTNAGACIYLPAGVYKITNAIVLPSNVSLRGDGPTKTVLLLSYGLNTGGRGDAPILAGMDTSRQNVAVTGGYTRGSTTLTVASASGLAQNYLCRFYQNDDTNVVLGTNTVWLNGATLTTNAMQRGNFHEGQMFFIAGLSGTTITTDNPIMNTNFASAASPQLDAFSNPTTNFGLESLSVSNTAAVANFNIYFYDCANFWINNVRSTNAVHANIELEDCYQGIVMHSDTWWHQVNDSNAREGIKAIEYSSRIAIVDCVCQGGNTAVMFQIFDSQNFCGYSFASIGWVGAQGSGNFANGFSCHGDFANFDAFEGNIGPWCPSFDETWGANRTCLALRNWATRDGYGDVNGTQEFNIGSPGVFLDSTNHWHTLIGNIVGSNRDAGQTAYSWESGYARGHGNNPPSSPGDPSAASTAVLYANYDIASGQYTNIAYTGAGTISNSVAYSGTQWWMTNAAKAFTIPAIGPDVSVNMALTNPPVINSQNRSTYGTNIFFDPNIGTQPASATIDRGLSAMFSVAANASQQPLYQWQFAGTNVPGATASSWTTPAQSQSGTFSVAVIVSDPVGTATSQSATLTVNTAPKTIGSSAIGGGTL